MSIAMASLSQMPIADASGKSLKKTPIKRLTVVAARSVLVPEPR